MQRIVKVWGRSSTRQLVPVIPSRIWVADICPNQVRTDQFEYCITAQNPSSLCGEFDSNWLRVGAKKRDWNKLIVDLVFLIESVILDVFKGALVTDDGLKRLLRLRSTEGAPAVRHNLDCAESPC